MKIEQQSAGDKENLKKNPSLQEVVNFAKGVKLDPDFFIKDSLDEKGNIKNVGERFVSFFTEKLKERFGEDQVESIASDDWFWKERELRDVLLDKLNSKELLNDIDKIVIIQEIIDISHDSLDISEGSFFGDELKVADQLIKKYNNPKTSVLEKTFLKGAIYKLYFLDELDSFYQEWKYDSLEAEIGQNKPIERFNDKKFSNIKFNLTKEQKSLILNDSNYDNSQEDITLEPIEIEEDKEHGGLAYEGDYITSMLSPDLLGVYTLRGRLVGWVSPSNIKEREVLGLEDSLKKNEITSIENLSLFKVSSSLEFRDYIENLIGSNLSKLSLSNQLYFLNYIQNRNEEDLKEIKNFIARSRDEIDIENKLKTFLSIEQGGAKMGDKILKLGEKLPENVAKEIFKKYGELIDSVDEVTEALKQKLNFTENSTDSEDAIKNNLLFRAKNLLEKYADNLNKNPKEILEEIEKIKVENVLTLSIFQSLHEIKGIRFEDMKDFSFSYEGQLNEDEKKEGEDIINKNYKDAPQEAREAILSSFKDAVNQKDKDIIFPNLKHKGKMVSFMQLNFAKYKGSDDYGKKVYFGSFNVDLDFANGEIGSAMMERTIDSIAKTHIVEADCNAEQNIGAKYIESGFTAVDFYDFKGLPGFKIIRDDKMKDKFIGKNLSKEEIISMLDNGLKKEGLDIISASQQKDFLPEFKKILNSTKIISRYFYDKNTKRWIVVVEPNLFSKEQE